jgi:hypothetical protein
MPSSFYMPSSWATVAPAPHINPLESKVESIATGAAASTSDAPYPSVMPASPVPGAAIAALARTERLVGRLDAVRKLGRSRRLRI